MTIPNDSNKLTISINGEYYQPSKKIITKNEILELVGIDDTSIEAYLLDDQGKKIKVGSDEGVELESGMRFLVTS